LVIGLLCSKSGRGFIVKLPSPGAFFARGEGCRGEGVGDLHIFKKIN
jgi:hypothetical protein